MPPAVEQVSAQEGNIGKLWRFFAHPPPMEHPASLRVEVFADQLLRVPKHLAGLSSTPFPLRDHDIASLNHPDFSIAATAVWGVALGFIAWRARRNEHRFARALAVICLSCAACGLWSVRRIPGGLHQYLLVWISVLGTIGCVPILLICRDTVIRSAGRHSRAAAHGVAGIEILACLGLASVTILDPAGRPPAAWERRAVRSATAAILDWRASNPQANAFVSIASHDQWNLVAGVVLGAVKHGWRLPVDDDWVFMFGEGRRRSGQETTELIVGADSGALNGATESGTATIRSGDGLTIVARSYDPRAVRFREGWGPREPWGRWAVATRARLQVPCLGAADTLVMRVAPFERMEGPSRCRVVVRGRVAREIEVAGLPWEWREERIPLPGSRCQGRGMGVTDVFLEIEPLLPGTSADMRALALPFERFEVRTTSPLDRR